jgi:hypothetical protein
MLSIDVNIAIARVDAQCTADGAVCPVCGTWSNRLHGPYLRFPSDVPSGGRRVVLQLRVRRFTCENPGCARRTFVEQIRGLTRRHSQRTERLRSTLASVGLALAGRAGARIAGILGVSVSRSTVLRLVDALPEPEMVAPRVVGVDEYAIRKGRHYGTVLIDIETRRPVDLLPYREASSLTWLAARPSVEVICRDRAPFFAEGATAGTPQAVQYRRLLWKRGVKPLIARRGVAHGSGLGKTRWVVERTFAWLHQFKRLRTRCERRADLHQALPELACCIICLRRMPKTGASYDSSFPRETSKQTSPMDVATCTANAVTSSAMFHRTPK